MGGEEGVRSEGSSSSPEAARSDAVPLRFGEGRISGALGVFLGALSIFLSRSKRLGFAGIALALAAQWLGGAHVEVDEFDSPVVSFGFDWLVLALLANSLVFVFIERVWPLRPEQPMLRSDWRLDLAYYAFNHVAVGIVLLATTFFSETLFGWAVHDGLRAVIGRSRSCFSSSRCSLSPI